MPILTAEEFVEKSFDFLVIGGGTAGLAVAARLSENPSLTVGVLEAGPATFGDSAVDLPGLAGQALGSNLDWQFETVPQQGLGGRKIPWARGRVIGGSSALNYMTWNRAARQDYDDWAELGNHGWGWDDLLPFFKKSETFHEPGPDAKTVSQAYADFMGRDGPVQVTYPKEYTASHGLWHHTMNSLGVKTNDMHMAGSNIGCWTSVCSVDPRSWTRSYATNAYYSPNASRPNLLILTDAEVQEILLVEGDVGSWEAKGIRFVHQQTELSIRASREVILSAGSIQSPQILELSGVGDEAVLGAAGIRVKVHNPNVGENLQDHLTTTSVFEVDPILQNPDDLKTPAGLAAALDEYKNTGTGPLTILPVSMSYVPLTKFLKQEEVTEILNSSPPRTQPSDDSVGMRDALLRRRFSGSAAQQLGHVEYIFDLGNWDPDFQPDPQSGKKYASMLQILQYPFSRGSVHIPPRPASGRNGSTAEAESNNNSESGRQGGLARRVNIDPQYYSGSNGSLDLEIAMKCHQFCETICSTEPLANIIRARVSPSPAEIKTDDDLRDWLKRAMMTDWHPVGTCAMGGTAGASAGVVDERLRVYGVRWLRVVDASVMPLQISGHLQATIYAIAEKAASMILEDLDASA